MIHERSPRFCSKPCLTIVTLSFSAIVQRPVLVSLALSNICDSSEATESELSL